MTRAAWTIVVSLVAAALALALPAGVSASPADVAAGESFVDGLYARYRDAPTPVAEESRQWGYASVYTPELVTLFDRSASFAGPDEVPEFGDGDHICQCQDWENFRVLARNVRETGDGRAEADVRFENAGAAKSARLVLARTPAGWRVADLFYDFYPNGLVAALRASIAEAERGRARASH